MVLRFRMSKTALKGSWGSGLRFQVCLGSPKGFITELWIQDLGFRELEAKKSGGPYRVWSLRFRV